MLGDELVKVAEDALAVGQGKQPHHGELLQLAMNLHQPGSRPPRQLGCRRSRTSAKPPQPGNPLAGVFTKTDRTARGPGHHSLRAERLLRRSNAAVKLESGDPALRPLFEDLAARLMKDDAKTRAMRVKVVYRLMEAGLPLLGIVEAGVGDRAGKAEAQRTE